MNKTFVMIHGSWHCGCPEIPGFPTSVPILHGSPSVIFKHTIPNQRVIAGDPNNPSATIPPSSTSPYQSFLVTATLPPNPMQPCFDWEVTAPLKLVNRVLQINRNSGTPGDGPVWNPLGGVQLNADDNYAPQDVVFYASATYNFPSVPGQGDRAGRTDTQAT